MVPGMTERDRRIADAQRLEWLADAVVGPARMSNASYWPNSGESHPSGRRLGFWRQRFTSALTQFRRIRLPEPRLGGSQPGFAEPASR
jgi:hypothetical protein